MKKKVVKKKFKPGDKVYRASWPVHTYVRLRRNTRRDIETCHWTILAVFVSRGREWAAYHRICECKYRDTGNRCFEKDPSVCLTKNLQHAD